MRLLSLTVRNRRVTSRASWWFRRQINSICTLIACVVGLLFGIDAELRAETTVEDNQAAPVFTQHPIVELPEDFVVRVDGNILRIALDTLDVIDAKRPTANLMVRLIDSNGNEKTTTSNAQGMAEFSNVKPNELHSILVVDQDVHAAVPVMTVSEEVASRKSVSAKRIVLPLMPSNPKEILASISRNISPRSNSGDSLLSIDDLEVKGANRFQVRLRSDGKLSGRMIVAEPNLAEKMRDAQLTFFRNNEVVARTDSNPTDGSFLVSGLATGVHAVVAAGPAGYAAFAFEVLAADQDPGVPGESVTGLPVSFTEAQPSEQLFVFLIPPKLVPTVTDRIREGFADATACCEGQSFGMQHGGGFGGGFGGGGGGGSGIGSFGDLIGLAAIAAVVSNNSDGGAVVVVSPIVP